jgi:hypothetical protein
MIQPNVGSQAIFQGCQIWYIFKPKNTNLGNFWWV